MLGLPRSEFVWKKPQNEGRLGHLLIRQRAAQESILNQSHPANQGHYGCQSQIETLSGAI
jgi:hypothetical protein